MTTSRKHLMLNAFSMNCVGHVNHGLWTHPRDRSTDYKDLDHWTSLARTLEHGLFDNLFLADVLGVKDVYGGSIELSLREGIQFPINDPLPMVAALGAATRHLGFGVTVNLTYESPYLLARRLSTIDHLTRGRLAWNIVTGYLDSAARAMGLTEQISHDERYDRGDEFLDLAYKLWEGGWSDDAVSCDRTKRVYARPGGVQRILHDGRHFHFDGYHLCEPSPQRTPLLFQAGASDRGQKFAATHAECVFLSGQRRDVVRGLVQSMRTEAVRQGRRADSLKTFMGVSLVLAPTDAQAQEKFAEYLHHASPEAGLANFASATGIDFSRYGMDEPIAPPARNDSIQSAVKATTGGPAPKTRRQLLEEFALGGKYVTIVGSPSTVADELLAWSDETGLDGFNVARTVTPECFEDVATLLVPELQNRGAFKTSYREGTLREKTFGHGPRLPADHPAARWRLVDAIPHPALRPAQD